MNNFLNQMNPYQMQPNYFNANYQPPQMSGYGAQAQARQSNVEWVYVNGIQGARDQIVQPGCERWMMDNNAARIYLKSVNLAGQPTLVYFDTGEIITDDGSNPSQHEAKMDFSTFATREDVEAIGAKVDKLIAEIGGMNV